MSDFLGALCAIVLCAGEAYWLWKRGLRGMFEDTRRVVDRLAHGPTRRPAAPPALPTSRCRHRGAPVAVEVHDGPDGATEVVGWLCPDCRESVAAPPPPPPPRDPDDDGTFIGEYARRGFRDVADEIADHDGHRWDTHYLKRESELIVARLEALTDGFRVERGAVSIRTDLYEESRALLARLAEIRKTLAARAEAAQWARLTEVEKHRRNMTAIRNEALLAGGILAPTELRVLACDHDIVNVCEFGSVAPVDSFCSKCGHRPRRS
jgi:hypothetical protein